MTNAHLKQLLKETGLSPEDLGKRMGVSGMTIRRWVEKGGVKPLPRIYKRALQDAAFQMITDGLLRTDSKIAQVLVDGYESPNFDAALKMLGLGSFTPDRSDCLQDQMVSALAQIGASEDRKNEVESKRSKILSFRKLGAEWNRRINTLMRVISSRQLNQLDKIAAYGALFYLLTPLDLIPDHIPVFGLLDDFGILGLGAAYYLSRFPDLLK